jgi:hypothetical protein
MTATISGMNARRTFGTELFIPHCYATVETTVPKMLSQLVRPHW